MYVVVRTFSNMHAIGDIARRAETGVGSILKQTPGFIGYYIFDAGRGLGGRMDESWRREGDSNPRDGFPPTHFPGVRLQPLGHPS